MRKTSFVNEKMEKGRSLDELRDATKYCRKSLHKLHTSLAKIL